MPDRRAFTFASAALAALLGALPVLAVFGPGALDPWNQGWLLAGPLGPDPVQLWLGWTYFVHSPWAWPPGANPNYGMELGTAIYFADAIPLLALLGKVLRGLVVLPQYVGPWLFLSGALQGFAAWLLLGQATGDRLARAMGAGLLALQPMLINRMAGHTPLAGQWLLLLALWLAVLPGGGWRRGFAWATLLGATALVHSYLLAMVAPLWLADALRRIGPRSLLEVVLVPAAIGGALWLGGFFLLQGGLASGPGSDMGGYGTWNADLLGWLDGGIWSGLLPDLPGPDHWEAGSLYLGAGGLALLLLGAVAFARHPVVPPRRLWLLLAALLALLGFAVTHRITLGGARLLELPLPEVLVQRLSALRNAERMVWPASYALMAAAVALAARRWGGRRLGWVLAGLLALQWVDLRPGLAFRHSLVVGAPYGVPQRLFDPFWAEAAPRYARVRAVPAANMGEGWESIARFAALAGLPTDSIYMARVDGAAVAALRARMAELLRSGAYEPGTLYILRDAESLALAEASHVPGRDLLRQADGYWVLAPGWWAR
ncbi:DUF6311 domain-containing protein [Siccirubricoccus sp. KC 17139]|uniref:DUF6311 domain-containing protein n=1 Tax=Siccirubricoccus soli TaxID=2899147 RepID=A0ABT1D1T4_9PROT|nr:DUF6311 domain-containing protein [Siccirubricoccus soli]MCO6415270.1 DUF6311 domain-containing protein [Siccirubricoccus soli]MCP2681401.1 DUF6311 domain-containing protein [Siccirubricoccus soli]